METETATATADLTLLNDSSNYEAILAHLENLRCTAEHPVSYITGGAGCGKAQPYYSKVLTPIGWCRIKDLHINSPVYAADGTLTHVTGVFPQGIKTVYRVTFSDGSYTDCCDEHLWFTRTSLDRRKNRAGSVKSLKDIQATFWGRPKAKTHLNHQIPMVEPVQFPEKAYYLDPYLLGVIIGDGSLTNGTPTIHNPDIDIINWVKELMPLDTVLTKLNTPTRCDAYSLKAAEKYKGASTNPITTELKRLDLWNKKSDGKFIPSEYLLGSVHQRLSLLRGLMDTDGTVNATGTGVSFCTCAESLANGVASLVQSLGGVAIIRTKIPHYTYNGQRLEGQLAYIVHICMPPSLNPFYLPRKANRVVAKSKYPPSRLICKIEKLSQVEECYCISIKHPEQLYVTDNYIVTHNTWIFQQAIQQQPNFAQMAASTGIAGVNLGTTTINQVLKYYNTESLYDSYQSGLLQKYLRLVRKHYRNLVLDENSMVPFQQIDLILWALDEINQDVEDNERLGLILVGDYAQLPPVPGNLIVAGKPVLTKDGQRNVKEPTPWGFKSELWSRFDEPGHTIKLEKVYRQSDATFLAGINAIRRGVGSIGVSHLVAAGVEFTKELDNHFDGTTIVGKNEEVDRVNKIRLQQLPGKTLALPSTRWWASSIKGWKQPSEWNFIPEQLELKVGAYVMCLANQKDPESGEIICANGDCGWVRELVEVKTPIYDWSVSANINENEIDTLTGPKIVGERISYVVSIELVRRPDELVMIPMIKRMIESRHEPDEDITAHPKFYKDENGAPKKVRNSMGRAVWCLGEIEYFPLRLAYSATTFKTQGLSLDRIQIDPRGYFMGHPGQCYVAISRGRTPEGIKIVGGTKMFVERVKIDPLVQRFL